MIPLRILLVTIFAAIAGYTAIGVLGFCGGDVKAPLLREARASEPSRSGA